MQEQNRRDFIKGTAWMGATAALAGCCTIGSKPGCGGGMMSTYADKPIKKVRVGFVGLGMRGPGAVHRIAAIPGAEVAALCDLYQDRVSAQQKFLSERKKPKAAEYVGEEAYKKMCQSDIDLVYVTCPWQLHAKVALYAMEHGKHVAIEVPAAMTIEECWALVETSERTGRHCMQLENCCYGEAEMLCLNLVRKGILGEIQHAEGAYIHDLRFLNYMDPAKGGYQGYWRLKWNASHEGNPYPTHGLVPVMQAMNINRGDRMEYLNCIQCNPVCNDIYAKKIFGADSWQAKLHPQCGDMATAMVRTAKGHTIMVQHNVNTPRPYSRHNLVQGTNGIFKGIDFCETAEDLLKAGNAVQFGWEKEIGSGLHYFFGVEESKKVREKYRHPLWVSAGSLAEKIGGHGGMDFLMDLRMIYCLQNGLPLDMDVYDLAASCSLCELSDWSCRHRGNSIDIPDFTRGGWKTAKPLGIVDIDIGKFDFKDIEKDGSALNV